MKDAMDILIGGESITTVAITYVIISVLGFIIIPLLLRIFKEELKEEKVVK